MAQIVKRRLAKIMKNVDDDTPKQLNQEDEGVKLNGDERNVKENGEIKKKKSFLNRRSLLDDYYCDSSISLSDFRGFYTAGVIFGVFYLLTDPILRYLNKGEIFPLVFINTFKKDYFLCLAHWPLYYLFSYTALGIQKAIIKGLNVNIALVLSNLTEFTLFGYTYFITMGREWGSTHAMFVSFICCTHYFKMHSYKEMNKKYRESRDPCYPLNVTIENFTLYMWMPVLVYEPHFPRNMTIDFKYIVYKSFIGALGILFAYIICCDNIIPYTSQVNEVYWFQTIFHIIFPLTILLIILFWVVFEVILNIFGEITRFGDRYFYSDWWNSTTFEEFNRKWNRPVYAFLFRHVYLECINNYQFSKKSAQLITFLFSALLHEWVFCLIFKSVKPVMFFFMLFQIPLFALTRNLQNKIKGNYFFWYGLIQGPPLIIVTYLRLNNPTT